MLGPALTLLDFVLRLVNDNNKCLLCCNDAYSQKKVLETCNFLAARYKINETCTAHEQHDQKSSPFIYPYIDVGLHTAPPTFGNQVAELLWPLTRGWAGNR